MQTLAIYSYAEFGVVASSFLPVLLTTRASEHHDPTHRRSGRALRRMARAIVAGSPLWRFEIRGTPPPDIARRPYVVVANHASMADPFLLAHLPWDMRFVAKQELFELPLIGWLLRLGGDIPVRRGDRESGREALLACQDTLARGLSVMLFPEGTRSRDGKLGPFKGGAFKLAISAGVPLLPIALHGTASCVGKAGLAKACARADILAPIDTTQCSLDDVPALTSFVRDRIAQKLADSTANERELLRYMPGARRLASSSV